MSLIARPLSKFMQNFGFAHWLHNRKAPPPFERGVRKTANGAYRCGCAPFLYAIMTYGTVAGSPLGSPSGRAVTEGDADALRFFVLL